MEGLFSLHEKSLVFYQGPTLVSFRFNLLESGRFEYERTIRQPNPQKGWEYPVSEDARAEATDEAGG